MTVPVGADGLPDPDAVVAAVDGDTVVVGLSAPCYPYGVVDPIADIAGRVAPPGIGVHVDAAMGGLFLPFLAGAGANRPGFGIDVTGVTSVAVDLHKYGYSAEGASVLLFAGPISATRRTTRTSGGRGARTRRRACSERGPCPPRPGRSRRWRRSAAAVTKP